MGDAVPHPLYRIHEIFKTGDEVSISLMLNRIPEYFGT